MKTVLSSFDKSNSLLSVTLCKSALTKDGEHYARVTRNTVTLENMIANINNENRGLDPYLIQHAATLLQQQILKELSVGNSVNILDLGTLYIAIKGTIKGNKPDAADFPDFIAKFTPSALTNEAVSKLVVDKIVFADNTPQISVITDLWTNQENSVISQGKTCKITGNHLKLGGDQYSISFVRCDKDGNEEEGAVPLEIESSKIFKNTQSELIFFTPELLLIDACYKIRITTMYLNSKQSRKTAVSTDSCLLTVA